MKFTLCDLYKATAPNKRRSRRSFWLRQIEKSKKPTGQKKKVSKILEDMNRLKEQNIMIPSPNSDHVVQ